MSDELRAAAERLMKHKESPYTESPYFFPDDHYFPGLIDHKRVDADKSLLADAYLAEHPADEDCRGPITSERWTLDELIAELEKWKLVASGKTCVSFENICYGASSLWHQTHRENFRKVDRKPEELSRWVLKYANFVHEDFPKQVLNILEQLLAENQRLKAEAVK